MAVYAIGDVQGCADCLERLLEKLKFDPSRDQVWFTGDLVNRGPDSLRTLRLVKGMGSAAVTVLGNHDLHLLGIHERIRRNRRGDTLRGVNRAPDIEELCEWLRFRPLAHHDRGLKTIMVHAGLYPGWSRGELLRNAGEVEALLRGPKYRKLLRRMYGRRPATWSDGLEGWERARFIINTLTRMRYVSLRGRLNFSHNGPPGNQPRTLAPWFRHPKLKCRKWRIVFGHWSAAGYFQEGNVIGLDSGCVWGGRLTAVRLDEHYDAPRTKVKCK